MPEYRAYVLDEHDHILFPIEIVEEDLSAGFADFGLEALHNAQWGELYPGAQYIELWQGDTRASRRKSRIPNPTRKGAETGITGISGRVVPFGCSLRVATRRRQAARPTTR